VFSCISSPSAAAVAAVAAAAAAASGASSLVWPSVLGSGVFGLFGRVHVSEVDKGAQRNGSSG
jgi:hypothetical protein